MSPLKSHSGIVLVLRLNCVALCLLVTQHSHGQSSPSVPALLTQPASSRPSQAQPPRSDDPAQLTDGLLELLKEPPAGRVPSLSPSALQPSATTPQSPPRAAALGSDGSSSQGFAAASTSPLLAVRDSMQRARLYLQQGQSDKSTVDAQADVIQRLDQLIAQLDQPQQNSQNNNSKQSQAAAGQQLKQQQLQTDSPRSASSPSTQSSSTPGEAAQPVDTNVRKKDPTALQKNVWGHLPGRVRKQMESRMVEEFLPSYREQIEAYYRALLEQGDVR